jgi:hypothetical protein
MKSELHILIKCWIDILKFKRIDGLHYPDVILCGIMWWLINISIIINFFI